MKKEDILYISDVTGELIDTLKVGDSYKIIRQEQKEYTQQNDTNFNKNESFLKFFDKNSDKLRKELTFSEIGFLLFLTKYICYEDGILRNGGNRKGNTLDIKDLAKKMDTNDKTIYRLVNNLKQKGVLCICDIGSIYTNEKNKKVIIINPYIFCRGNSINNTIKTLFQNSGWI